MLAFSASSTKLKIPMFQKDTALRSLNLSSPICSARVAEDTRPLNLRCELPGRFLITPVISKILLSISVRLLPTAFSFPKSRWANRSLITMVFGRIRARPGSPWVNSWVNRSKNVESANQMLSSWNSLSSSTKYMVPTGAQRAYPTISGYSSFRVGPKGIWVAANLWFLLSRVKSDSSLYTRSWCSWCLSKVNSSWMKRMIRMVTVRPAARPRMLMAE